MTQAIPPVPRGLSYDLAQFLQALRLALGGNSATTAPAKQAEVLSPVATVTTTAPDRAPVIVTETITELDPI